MRLMSLGLFAAIAGIGFADESPRARYDAIVREFDAAQKAYVEAVTKATDDTARAEAFGRRPDPRAIAGKFLAIAETNPADPVAIDALTWVVSHAIFGPEATKALDLIGRDHARSPRLLDFCGRTGRYGEPFPPFEAMLRAVMKANPDRATRAAATLTLADYLKMAKETTESRVVKIAASGEQSFFPARLENIRQTQARGLDALGDEAARLYKTVIDEYADVTIPTNIPARAGDYARMEVAVLRDLAIGRTAPEIVGADIHGKPMRLSDFRGKVVVLNFGSHRSCGVCRQMNPSFRTMVETFEGRPFALLGISVDDDVKELLAVESKGETTWPIWFDGGNLDGPIASRWMIRSMPTIVVLDRAGVIRDKGFIQPPDIEATVTMLLKEPIAAK